MPDILENDLAWPPITSAHKPWTRWWWMGSAVDEANLARELREMRDAGIGGVEVTPIYSVHGFEDREIPFLSKSWLEMLAFAAREAHRLEMGLDMPTGTGWPFGGPMVSESIADAKVKLDDGLLVKIPSGMKVKRAAPGGEGWVLNPYSPAAMREYLQAFENLPKDLIRCQFHDSFEYAGNYSADVPKRFREMHGYDLADRAADLFGEKHSQVKHDFRETLGQLHLEYVETWVKWCHERGYLARNQAHGAPGNLLDLYGIADIPETETFGSTHFDISGFRRESSDVARDDNGPNPIVARFASSAAHVAGRNLVSCETLTWLREHFKVSLAMAKPEIDQMFVCGINHIFYHGTCYSPADAPWPGWQFYASSEINSRDPMWKFLPEMNRYIARCQSILQSGEPDSDVLLYFPYHDHISNPDGLETRFVVHARPKWLVGTPFEKVARDLIDRGIAFDMISDRQLLEADLQPFNTIVVPPTTHMPVPTRQRLRKLEQAGKCIFWDESHVSLRGETFARNRIEFIRRRHADGHHYFIANLGSTTVDGWMKLSVDFQSAALLDPLTGVTGIAQARKSEIYLQLEPGQSIFIRTFSDRTIDGPKWPYIEATGSVHNLSDPWQIDFVAGGPEIPGSISTSALRCWTTFDDPKLQSFCGKARYRTHFDRPPGIEGPSILDLGDVREAASMTLNGQRVGSEWCLPFKLRLPPLLDRNNVLEIDVTNLPANRIRDLDRRRVPWRMFKDANMVNINYQPFDASNWPLAPSGLLGPVTITPVVYR